jgi:hypothetical protein
VRLLYLLTHAGLFRNFDSTLRLLAERGHEVHVALDSERYPSAAFDALVAASPTLTVGRTPLVANDRWQALGRSVRAGSDYVRYLDRRYTDAPKLRARARRQVPAWLQPVARPGADRWLRGVERALPLDRAMVAFIRERRPDLVAVSPLFGSAAQLEALRAARSLGVPTCMTVASWDNLTNKGLIREVADTVAVWNEAQRSEAVELHGVPAARVVITGAQNFDEWFDRSPSSSYADFVSRLGLRPDRPYLLYLGSSSFIAPDEADFAADWLRRLRACPDPRLREIGVIFRPHPQNARQWDRPDLVDDPQVGVHPPPASAPQQTGRADWSRDDFYDSMYHAAAVIGVNTTAMIESAVLGRSVHTLLAPRFHETQEGTLHFAHLRTAGGGLLHLTEDFDAHFASLADAVSANGAPDRRSRRFIEAFVRPHGLDRPATPALVDALEHTAQVPPIARSQPASPPRALLEPLAAVALAAERATSTRRRKQLARFRKRLVRRLRRLQGSGGR